MNIPENIQAILQTTKPISETELRRLLKAYRLKRILKLKEQIIKTHLWLVVKIAQKFYKKYSDSNLDAADLIEEGIIGLLKAINRYKPEMNSSFRLYAEYWIKQSIQLYLNEKPFIVAQLPSYVLVNIKKWFEAWNQFIKTTGRKPTLKEMSQKLKVSYYKIKKMFHQLNMLSTVKSLNTPVGEESTIEDFIKDDSMSPEEILSLISTKETLEEVFNKVLTKKERTIIKQRYQQWGRGIFKKRLSYRKIAKMLHVSPEHVRQVEKRVLKKLAKYLKEKFY
ncbi:MAG: sigma-70 family RNA polymerase sigma factor [Endomicrobia bacterium]|nr:sigma-70 family RNA polymerase sigma factor [Endomicrobiia bacterium]